VIDLRKTLSSFRQPQEKRWKELMEAASQLRSAECDHSPPSRLRETQDFGSNPGALRMFSYIPPGLPANCALVVILHGCAQSAAGYDRGAGWSTLADRFGFALLLPEQQRANNPNGCFNWFLPADIERGSGETLSIRQMVDKLMSDHEIDRRRVFVTGLSAGGAMTSVMLATYPDVFVGGAIIAGLPYGAANNVQQAFETMFQCAPRSARAWGDLVRSASPHRGPWPRISVWHGGADATVVPANATEILKQWTDVHGLPRTPTAQATVDGYPRQVWIDETGDEVIESYTIPQMAHGTPLATGEARDQCGVAGPFLIEAGISSSYHIARFFGLTSTELCRTALMKGESWIASSDQQLASGPLHSHSPLVNSEVLHPEADTEVARTPSSLPSLVNVRAVITQALKAAGLTSS
jgi:feruloyl esterase